MLRKALIDAGALPATPHTQLTVGLFTGVSSYVSGIDYYTQVRYSFEMKLPHFKYRSLTFNTKSITQINEGVALALESDEDIAGGHSSKMVDYSADLEEYCKLQHKCQFILGSFN